jgi:hypothetical protein
MFVTLNSKKYKLYFRKKVISKKHVIDKGPGYEYSITRRWIETKAIIETEVETFFGIAVCQPMDAFSKEKGRTLALAKALESFDRKDRNVFWETYHNRCPKSNSNEMTIVDFLATLEDEFKLQPGALTSQIPIF